MPQTGCPPAFRATTHWLRTTVLAAAVLLIATACTSSPTAAPTPDVITDKGTPYADLLVPKLEASVTDGAIGVAVDAPVTVTAGDGVLGQVSLTNEAGDLSTGNWAPTALHGHRRNRWATTSSTPCRRKHKGLAERQAPAQHSKPIPPKT